ncbi:hypothetical protein D1164_17810 [Mariniphaga sediminis]|jgi:hypothetical protein|uniref:Four helix bundle protein n=1 Tax=Mariniphaga sediminis TaxID=1628158 RepID=A0A399CZG1_9BACT|nr:hypothetical protein [Mariniphaga sediminis]RIH63791.1 hypothetical protein D1164_17810 [Mariniphaga sediminis]
MKLSRRGFSLFSLRDIEYFNKEEKFELVNCPLKGKYCKRQLPEINQSYSESEQYRKNKEYRNSIDALKNAYSTTTELKEDSCSRCVNFFRSSITESLEDIHGELHKMSTGLFRTKRFESSYFMLGDLLKELKMKN